MRLPFPEQRTGFDDSGFVNLEPRDYWAECYGCFNNGAAPSGGGSNEPRGTTFGVDGRSVTGSTAQDAAIGYTDGQGGRGANFDQMSQASSSDIRAAVAAANKAAAENRNTIQAASIALGGGDDYNIGSGGEFSTAAMAAPTVTAPVVAGGPRVDTSTIAGITAASGGAARPEARITVRPKVPDNIMTSNAGILGRSVLAAKETGQNQIPREVALTALQDRSIDGDTDARRELDRLFKEGAVTFPEANYAFLQQQKQIDASRILNQAPVTSTPIQVDDGTGVPVQVKSPDDIIREQRAAAATPVDGALYGGYEDDPAYDADIFGVARFAGGRTGLDGNLQGFENARQMSDFIEEEVRPTGLQSLLNLGPVSQLMQGLTGRTVTDMNRDALRDRFEAGAQYNPDTGQLEGGIVDRASPVGGGGGGGAPMMPPAQVDPCPEGYKLVDGVCQPIEAAEERVAGSSFQQTPVTNMPTTFAPTTQATPVGTINPFVLRPTQVQGFAMGGDVDPYEAELQDQAAAGGSGSTLSGGFDFSGSDDDNDTQTVIATPMNQQEDTQTVIATPMPPNTPPPVNAEPLQPVTNLGTVTMPPPPAPTGQSQPGLAKTLLEGAADIFGPTITQEAKGQTQVPVNLQSYVPVPDTPVQGISGLQNVRGNDSFSLPSPEQFRESLGLPQDVPGAIGDFFSGLGQKIMGPQDTFRNLGTLGQSKNMYQGGNQRPFR